MRRSFVWIALTAVVVARAAGGVATTNAFDVVAETEGQAPGLPAAVQYSLVQYPITDGTGTFLFESQLRGGSGGSAVFVGKRGAVQPVAVTTDAAPGAGGLQWSKLSGVGNILRPTGRVAFQGELDVADTATKGGIWVGMIGNLQLLVREGDPAPGTTLNFAAGARYFQDGLHLAMNDAGQIALRAKLAGAGVTTANDQAIFTGTPGALTLVARLGDAAPDVPGATLAKTSTEGLTAPSINASGRILFRGHLAGASVTTTTADAIWFGDPAAPTVAVRGGQPVTGPGIPPNSHIVELGSERPVLNDAGQILFESPYDDGTNLVRCVWLGPPQSPAAIAIRGQSVPGDSQGSTLGGSVLHLRMNGNGHAAFHMTLSSGASDWALFVWDGAALREVWRTGDPAPGMPDGETYGGSATEDIYINELDQVLFRTSTAPSLITGVWLWDPQSGGAPRLLARIGGNVTLGTATKVVTDLLLYSGPDAAGSPQDGRGSPLGDDGTYAILGKTADDHLEVLTNAGGAAPSGAATPSSLSVGTTIDVTGSGFGAGAKKFHPPKAWLTVGSDPRKIPLKVDPKTASDTEFHATFVALRKGAHGPATLHVLPSVKHAAEITMPVTIELPSPTSLSATELHGGDTLTLTGAYFGAKKRLVEFRATVNGKLKTWKFAVKSWTDDSITAVVPKRVVPKGQTTLEGDVVVTNDAGDSETSAFTVDG
jgi:hypothetical protein